MTPEHSMPPHATADRAADSSGHGPAAPPVPTTPATQLAPPRASLMKTHAADAQLIALHMVAEVPQDLGTPRAPLRGLSSCRT